MTRLAVMCACVALLAGRACAEPWSSVFAAERDTAVFLATDGTLFRAPFSLESRDVLWRASRNQHVVRFVVSPTGGRIAWIVRGSDEDTTRLWLATANGIEQPLRYSSLKPQLFRQTHSEADVPTLSDRGARGVRLIQAGLLLRRNSANTLEWMPDSRRVLLGGSNGMVSLAPGSGAERGPAGILAVKLHALRPSNLFLVDALALDASAEPAIQGSPFDLFPTEMARFWDRLDSRVPATPVRGPLLLNRTRAGWRKCAANEWERAHVRAVGTCTVWWAEGNKVCALRADSCMAAPKLDLAERVVWLGYDEAHGDVLIASGRRLWRMPEAGGARSKVLEASGDIRAVLQSRSSATLALVTKDSLIVWKPGTGETLMIQADGLVACGLYEGPDGSLVAQVDCGAGLPHSLARVDPERACLVPVECPKERWGVFAPAAGGAWILFYDPGSQPPQTLHAYDVIRNRWHEVENPGLSAWEPVR